MADHPVVSHEEWEAARKKLLEKEKESSKLREELTTLRQNLPWEKVEKEYTFDGPNGQETLAELFEGKSQLIVYHFLFDPDWKEGCKSCSIIADHYNPSIIHLNHRDVAMVTVSRAPLEKLEAYKKRMGWSLKWLSSFGSDFNFDYHVSFTPEQAEKRETYYNYRMENSAGGERPGISVFGKNAGGEVFHTYSSFGRGLENFIGAYNLLDIVPKGRDESALKNGMDWVRRHDQY
ncbi:MAG: thioredoxin family protein [Bryobacteraceae bacterium]|jgi:predicted dithiol-disulfide oxidoreductase (DUF899 family)